MAINRRQETISTAAKLRIAPGTYFLFLSATASTTVRVFRRGVFEVFEGVTGGLILKRVSPWEELILEAAAGTVVEFFIGDEVFDEDETDIRLAVTQIAGSVSIRPQPSSSVTTPDDETLAPSPGPGDTLVIAANPTLYRRTIGVRGDSNAGVRVQATGASADSGEELVPGVSKEFSTFSELTIRNNSTTDDAIVYVYEEA